MSKESNSHENAMEINLTRLPFCFDTKNPDSSAKTLLQVFRPDLLSRLDKEELKLDELAGGITNKLLAAYFAGDKKNKTLIRVYGAETDKIIDRDAEIQTLLTLNKNKCCGKVYGVFENGMCYEYLRGVPLTLSMVCDEHISKLVTRELVQLHAVSRNGGTYQEFCLFDKMLEFYQLIPSHYEDPEKQRKFKEFYPHPEQFVEEIEVLRKHLSDPSLPSPKVFCHNDLLCANILYDKTEDCVSFIDFEYAGLNYQAYDLANHFNEMAGVEDCDYKRFPSREYQLSWLKFYLECWHKLSTVTCNGNCDGKNVHGHQVTDDEVETLFVMVNKFTLASHLLWTMWTCIQANHSTIDFDFLVYGKLRYDEYLRRKEECLSMKIPLPKRNGEI